MGYWSLVVSFVLLLRKTKPLTKELKKALLELSILKNLNTTKQALSKGIADCDSNTDNAMRMHMCNDSVALIRVF